MICHMPLKIVLFWLEVFILFEEKPPCLPKIKSNDIDENTLLKKDSISGLQKK